MCPYDRSNVIVRLVVKAITHKYLPHGFVTASLHDVVTASLHDVVTLRISKE
jgi:hypothetical protein